MRPIVLIRGQLLGAFRLDFFDGFDLKKITNTVRPKKLWKSLG